MKINGKQIANTILQELKAKVKRLREKNIIPHLAIILIGNDPASKAYVRQKELKGKLIGAKIKIRHFPSFISQSNLLSTIQQFNNNNNIHGIIVQQPLPPLINIERITQAIDPKKDIDGFHPNSKFQSPIALAVLRILEEIYWKKSEARNPKSETNSNNQNSKFKNSFLSFEHSNFDIVSSFDIRYSNFIDWLKSKNIVIVGKGETGGKPIINSFKKMGINPTVIDSKTKNPKVLTKTADIIISAVGKPQVVKSAMIKKGVILISIGLHKETDGKLRGDYNEDEIKNKALFYTPTPGGVGPVNVAMLLKNLIKSSENFSR